MKGIWARVAAELEEQIPHAVGMLAAVFTIAMVRWSLEHFVGEDASFFDVFPVRYATDSGEMAAFVRFLARILWR